MKTVLVFGVFDGIHEGHRAFLRQARALGDYLVAVVAQDSVVRRLKGHLPGKNIAERIGALRADGSIDEAVAGDEQLGSYEAAKKYRPAVIALGYDQRDLKKDLKTRLAHFDWKPRIVVLEPHEPEKCHSSIARGCKV